jgi:hypothetical protein
MPRSTCQDAAHFATILRSYRRQTPSLRKGSPEKPIPFQASTAQGSLSSMLAGSHTAHMHIHTHTGRDTNRLLNINLMFVPRVFGRAAREFARGVITAGRRRGPAVAMVAGGREWRAGGHAFSPRPMAMIARCIYSERSDGRTCPLLGTCAPCMF